MVLKRIFGEGEDEGFPDNNQEAKRRITSSSFAQNTQNAICGISTQQLISTLETLVRRCVRDEVQRSCESYFSTLQRSPVNALKPCTKTSLQLRILANLRNTFFTGSRIESEDNSAVKLALYDVGSNRIVTSGPFSSLKVEIVPLDGDFCVDDEEDWSENEFNAKVISPREGRRPLITGDLVVTLENGVADLGELCFTDNSSWRRSRKFMFGARVKDASSGVRIREAKSQAFMVKDHRGESYKKHYPPQLCDEIWRLEKIAKDGVFHKRLASHNIFTVKDFLQMYVTNQSLLRKLLGGSSNKTWETIIKHAKTCVLDDQNYMPLDNFSAFQMPKVEALKQEVYKNLDVILPINDPFDYGVSVAMDDHSSMEYLSPALMNEFSNESYGEDVVADFDYQIGTSLWQGNELFIDTSNRSVDIVSSDFGICFSKNGSPRGRWCKIRAAVKWDSVRRDVAAKKVAELHSFFDF